MSDSYVNNIETLAYIHRKLQVSISLLIIGAECEVIKISTVQCTALDRAVQLHSLLEPD